jgi:hypothetical protein
MKKFSVYGQDVMLRPCLQCQIETQCADEKRAIQVASALHRQKLPDKGKALDSSIFMM